MRPLGSGDPRELGGYRLLGRLGTGGMGQVFLGRAPDGRMAAVKLIHPHLAAEPEFRRRFRHEVAAARRVSGEWTMPVLDSDTEAEIPWLATGFVPGPSLARVVDELNGGPLPEFSVWRLAEGLARALAAIHGAGVAHRDLKPSNVLITLEGPRVIDFGIARAADVSVATRTGVAVGSPGYMSPEQIRGEHPSEASDVFGLGAVLAYAATGQGPFGATDSAPHTLMHRVLTEMPDLSRLAGPMRELVAGCLAKEAGARPTPAQIAEEAARHQDPEGAAGVWLPPGLTAELGKEAARLLAVGSPEQGQGQGPGPGQAVEPAAGGSTPHNSPTMTSSTPPAPSPYHHQQQQPPPPPAPAAPAPAAYTPPPHATPAWPPGASGPQQPYPQQPATGYPAPAYPGGTMYPAAVAVPMAVPVPYAPFGYDHLGRPYSNKSKVAAGLLQLFLGYLGIGRFYTGHVGIGVAQLITCGGCGIWALIDGIVLLASDSTDSHGRVLK